jgi:hypothetical protein
MQQAIHLGEMLAVRLAGQPITQLTLDLQHVCPLTGRDVVATKYTGRSFWLYENRSDNDMCFWRKYLANVRNHNRITNGY